MQEENNFSNLTKDEDNQGKKWDYIISFSSVSRTRFEFITCLLVLYDCIMLPFDIAFDIYKTLPPNMVVLHEIINTTLKIFYFIDFCICFRKAYLDERTGREVRNPKLIAIRYVKFYFWFDLVAIIPFELLSNSVSLKQI